MKSNSTMKRLNFKDEILPDFEVLLRFSLWLIKKERQSTGLMREAMAEACRSCHDSVPDESCKRWLEEVVPRSLFGGRRYHACPFMPNVNGYIDTSLEKDNRLIPDKKTNVRPKPYSNNGSDDDAEITKDVTSLPAACRFAIILSYLEGFSDEKIANLVGAQPHEIKSLLGRGRGMLREEYYKFLCDNSRTDTGSDKMVASG